MTEDLADTTVSFIVCLFMIITWVICFELGYTIGEDNLTEKLCAKQQYDFCEVIEKNYIQIKGE